MEELDLGPQLHTFVRVGVESTLERSQLTRDHMGQLLLQLLRQGPLPKSQFIKGSVPCLHRRYISFTVSLTRESPDFLQPAFAPTVGVIQFLVDLNVCVFAPARFAETLEQADDMAIDIPHIWLYLAQLLSPVLREGGFSMRELFR